MNSIESLERALAASPDNIPLLIILAEAYLGEQAYGKACYYYGQVLNYDAGNVQAKLGQARCLMLEGRLSESMVRVESLCKEDPSLASAWLIKAEISLLENDDSNARVSYRRACELDPSMRSERLELDLGVQAEVDYVAQEQKRVGVTGGGENYGEQASFIGNNDENFANEFKIQSDSKFSDVGGMEKVKEDIRMKIIYPLQNQDLFAEYGKKAGGGVLLYGPPGCGKTMISRATAGEINANYYCIGLHQILDMWLGGSEKQLHEVFASARKSAPAVLFFDEIDALAADRRDLRGSSGRTLINQFLAELDGAAANNENLLVIGATNAPWNLDAAFLRPGRFDRIIFVPPPDEQARESILRLQVQGKPVGVMNYPEIARKTNGFSGADLNAVVDASVEEALELAMKKGKRLPLTTKGLVKAAKSLKPSTKRWFESAKNYALYANQGGLYDPVLEYLNIKK